VIYLQKNIWTVICVTYSIVARDLKTGELGVAVQSHYFSVGSTVTWARSGVGAIATQSMAEVSYGPMGLDLMASGKTAIESLQSLLRTDPRSETRQVGMVDANGNIAVHTGSRCIDYAGHVSGEQFSCQANLMSNDTIWGAMERQYRHSENLELPERLVATLQAAEEAGGDARGKQSAALLVVSGKVYANQWMGKLMELRIEDHPEPLSELERLVKIKRAYGWVDKGDDLLAIGKVEDSMKAYRKAQDLVPGNEEIRFWVGITLAGSQATQAEGLRIISEILERNKNWKNVTRSLLEKGYLPKENPVRELL
jgi:uncharacterized Ntn-hydrolase superfamily protein